MILKTRYDENISNVLNIEKEKVETINSLKKNIMEELQRYLIIQKT